MQGPYILDLGNQTLGSQFYFQGDSNQW